MINKYCQIQESSTAREPTSTGEPKNKRDWRKESFLFELRSSEFERFSQSNASFFERSRRSLESKR